MKKINTNQNDNILKKIDELKEAIKKNSFFINTKDREYVLSKINELEKICIDELL